MFGPSSHPTPTHREVHDLCHAVLQTCLQFSDYGRTCSAGLLVSALLYAACRAASLTAVCRRLRRLPSDETLRQALLANLPEPEELERRLGAGLTDRLPRALRKRAWPLAIDYCDLPYYGQPQDDPRQLRRGPAQRGTAWRHTYATACVVRQGYRFTLAATWVRADDSLVDVLQRLLGRVAAAGVKVRYLLLDRAFYEADVIRYLQRARCPFLMSVKLRGRRPQQLATSPSAYHFLSWRHGGWSDYTWRDAQGRRATVHICVAQRRYEHRGKRKRQVLLFAYWGFQPASIAWVRETYRKRFGIETSHRQAHQARIPTTSRDPGRRLLFVVVALIVRNVWAWLHRVRLAVQGKIRLERLPFIDLLQAIACFLEARTPRGVLGDLPRAGPRNPEAFAEHLTKLWKY